MFDLAATSLIVGNFSGRCDLENISWEIFLGNIPLKPG